MHTKSSTTKKVLSLLASALRHADDILRPKAPVSGTGHRKNFLFLSYSPALGTSVNGTPIFEAMKAAFPSCRIAVCASGVPYQVVQHNPYVDYAWNTADVTTDPMKAVRQIRCHLGRHNFQPDYTCTDSWNSRSKIVLIGYLVARAYRAGFSTHSGLLHRPLQYKPRLSLIDNNLRSYQCSARRRFITNLECSFRKRIFCARGNCSVAAEMMFLLAR
jgi:hypothetical protein